MNLKGILLSIVTLVAMSAKASEQWCVWDGEEYIKETMGSEKKHWLEVVYGLHTSDLSQTPDVPFEALGSCRFINRNLGETALDVIQGYLNSFSLIVPSRAYLKFDGSFEIILPKAVYAAGSSVVLVQKDFYSVDRPMCEKQKVEMTALAQEAQGIRFTDVEVMRHQFGGTSVLINKNTMATNYLGVCHFQ